MIDLPPRFWSYVTASDGCWMWTAYRDRDGYGQFANHEKTRPTIRAHKLAYLALIGDVPKGLVLDHLCKNPSCVNPWHLEPVKQKLNLLRSPETFNAKHAATTHCPQGHEYTQENTWIGKDGRHCKTCTRIRTREINRRKNGYYLRHVNEASGSRCR